MCEYTKLKKKRVISKAFKYSNLQIRVFLCTHLGNDYNENSVVGLIKWHIHPIFQITVIHCYFQTTLYVKDVVSYLVSLDLSKIYQCYECLFCQCIIFMPNGEHFSLELNCKEKHRININITNQTAAR